MITELRAGYNSTGQPIRYSRLLRTLSVTVAMSWFGLLSSQSVTACPCVGESAVQHLPFPRQLSTSSGLSVFFFTVTAELSRELQWFCRCLCMGLSHGLRHYFPTVLTFCSCLVCRSVAVYCFNRVPKMLPHKRFSNARATSVLISSSPWDSIMLAAGGRISRDVTSPRNITF